MNKENNNISQEEKIDNLYLDLYKKRIDKISLDLKISKLSRTLNELNIKNNKLTKNKLFIIALRLFYSLIICMLDIGYIYLLTNKIIPITIIPKVVHISSIYIGVITISLLGAFIISKVENKIKKKRKKKQIELSNEIEEKINEMYLNNETLKGLDTQIKNILKEINRLENTNENKKIGEEINYSYNDENQVEEVSEKMYVRKRML